MIKEAQAVNFISDAGFRDLINFVGIILNSMHSSSASFRFNSWIMDTGASSHLCINNSFFDTLHTLHTPLKLHLRNGSVKLVTKRGDMFFAHNTILLNTLFAPNFKHNLLSISSLMRDNKVMCIFYPDKCLLQDRLTSNVLATKKARGNLYFLDQTSFDTSRFLYVNHHALSNQFSRSNDIEPKIACIVVSSIAKNKGLNRVHQQCKDISHKHYRLWHCKLGHAPFC